MLWLSSNHSIKLDWLTISTFQKYLSLLINVTYFGVFASKPPQINLLMYLQSFSINLKDDLHKLNVISLYNSLICDIDIGVQIILNMNSLDFLI